MTKMKISRPGRFSPLLLYLLLGVGGWLLYQTFQPSLHDPDALPRPVIARGDLADDEKNTIEKGVEKCFFGPIFSNAG